MQHQGVPELEQGDWPPQQFLALISRRIAASSYTLPLITPACDPSSKTFLKASLFGLWPWLPLNHGQFCTVCWTRQQTVHSVVTHADTTRKGPSLSCVGNPTTVHGTLSGFGEGGVGGSGAWMQGGSHSGKPAWTMEPREAGRLGGTLPGRTSLCWNSLGTQGSIL